MQSVPAIQKGCRSNPVRKLALLAPCVNAPSVVPDDQLKKEAERYEEMLFKVQRLRGEVYLKDGAVQRHELNDGRHEMDLDWESWHLLVLDHHDQVLGCARYTPRSNRSRFSELNVSRSSLARSSEWGSRLEAAVESELDLARRRGVPYVELGGWALAESIRGSAEALRMVLAIYGLAQELGGVVGISTATKRHCSASILKRIGGISLEHSGSELPSYFDPQYNCEMEVLRFHSWAPNPRYLPWIDEIKAELRNLGVFDFGKLQPSLIRSATECLA